MGLSRHNNEKLNDYIYRVGNEKEIEGYTWIDIQLTANQEFGLTFSVDKYRKQYNSMVSKKYSTKLIHTADDGIYNEQIDEYNEIQDRIAREKIKLSDYRTQNNANNRLEARYDSLKEIAVEVASTISKDKKLNTAKSTIKSDEKKEAILAIGDWHYGLDVDETWNKFSPEICAERVSVLRDSVVEILKKEKINKITIINLGDMISGNIHLQLRIASRLDVVSQTIGVSELLAEFLSDLSQYAEIRYCSVTDNHSRIEPNKANSFRPETFARIIEWYLEERLKGNENIEFLSTCTDDIADIKVFDHNIIAVHGDRDPQRGILEKLNCYLQKHFDLILSAHMHHFSADESNGTEFYCIGSLIGTDQYASGLRLNSKPSQLMIISTPENVTQCIYKIKLA